MSAVVSVVLAVNNATHLDRAIRSIYGQSFQDWELIVIDDCAPEPLSGPWLNDRRVRLIRNPSNLGLAASLNKGIAQAVTPLVARMDADDVCYPERFALQVKALEERPDVDVVGCGAMMFRGEGNPLGVLAAPEDHVEIAGRWVRGSFPLFHPAWMGRHSWFTRFPYDTHYRKSQDFELLLRACRHSRFMNVQKILLGYRYETSSLSKRLESRLYVLKALTQHAPSMGGRWGSARAKGLTWVKAASDVIVEMFRLQAFRERATLQGVSSTDALQWSGVWDETSPTKP